MWAFSILSSILNSHFSLKKGKNLHKTSFVLTEDQMVCDHWCLLTCTCVCVDIWKCGWMWATLQAGM